MRALCVCVARTRVGVEKQCVAVWWCGGGGSVFFSPPMATADFKALSAALTYVGDAADLPPMSDHDRISLMKQAASRNYFSSAQVRDLVDLVALRKSKIEAAVLLHARCTDQANFIHALQSIDKETDRQVRAHPAAPSGSGSPQPQLQHAAAAASSQPHSQHLAAPNSQYKGLRTRSSMRARARAAAQEPRAATYRVRAREGQGGRLPLPTISKKNLPRQAVPQCELHPTHTLPSPAHANKFRRTSWRWWAPPSSASCARRSKRR